MLPLRSYESFDYDTKLMKETFEKTGKLILKGILQKADTLNQNGRIYPKSILEREVRNYQKFILENRSTGELDHPDCVTGTAEIMTKSGWKFIKDIAEDEVIFTMNLETNKPEYHQITEKVDQKYDGKMIHIYNDHSYDMVVTPNHRVLLYDKIGIPMYVTAQDILEKKIKDLDLCSIRCSDNRALNSFYVLFDNRNAEYINSDGRIYCVKVKNENWLMRYKGHVCLTGNSSVVSLSNVSHIIREAYFEGNNVYGSIEVLDKVPSGKILAGLVESGVKIGISSRGVGSTKQEGDCLIVQDDFQLICWDVVQDPSTPGAFMLPESKIHSVKQEELKKIFNKTDRIDRIINDILSY